MYLHGWACLMHPSDLPWEERALENCCPFTSVPKNREELSLACNLEPSPADLDSGRNSHQTQSRSTEPWLTQRPIIMRINACGHKPLRFEVVCYEALIVAIAKTQRQYMTRPRISQSLFRSTIPPVERHLRKCWIWKSATATYGHVREMETWFTLLL